MIICDYWLTQVVMWLPRCCY